MLPCGLTAACLLLQEQRLPGWEEGEQAALAGAAPWACHGVYQCLNPYRLSPLLALV